MKMRSVVVAIALSMLAALFAIPLSGSVASAQVIKNDPPVIDFVPTQFSQVGEVINGGPTATDPDGDTITWTATGLPNPLVMNPNGIITGTLTTAGSYNVTLVADDGNGNTDTEDFVWVVQGVSINQPPVPVNPGDQASTVNDVAALTLTATDLEGDPITWTATGLPTGLTIAADGTISGTKTAAGTYTIVATADDGQGNTTDVTFDWVVAPAPNQPPVPVNPGDQASTVDDLSTLVLTATDPDGDPITWSATGLPAGLTINANDGAVKGTKTVAGTYTVVATADDGQGNTTDVTFDWVVAPAPNQPPVPVNPGDQASTVNDAAALTLTATDPEGDPITWTATGLPTGVTIAADGTISGTKTAAGTYTIVATADDGQGNTTDITFDWVVAPAPNQPPVPVNPGDQASTVNDAAALTLTATDPEGDPITWTATGLPTGVTIAADGTISGTKTAAGTYTVVATADDGQGNTTDVTFDWVVAPAPPVNQPPVPADPGPRASTVNDAVALTLTATDPEGDPITWTATGLPTGLTISPAGAITGTKTAAGTYTVVATADDGQGNTTDITFTWTVSALPVVNQPPVPVSPGDQASTVNDVAALTLTATDPEGDPVTWTATGLPTGLTISPAGAITGTKTATGTYTVVATADDGQGNTTDVTFDWVVSPAPVPAPVLTSPVAGSTLDCANQTFTWTGNADRYAIYLGTSSQVFYDLHISSGITAGTTSYTVPTLPTDGSPVTLRFYYFINGAWEYDEVQYTACTPPPVNQPPVPADPGDQASTVNDVAALTLTATDPEGDPVTWTATGLPTGLTISPAGAITGTKTAAGTYTIVATADDGQGNTTDVTFDWVVSPAPVPAPVLTSPVAGSTLDCANQTFTWTGNATRFAIYLGTSSQVFYDLHISSGISAGTTSYTVPTLPTDGSPVTLRFYYFINGAWEYDEVQYTACTPPPVNQPPVAVAPADQTNTVNDVVSLALAATDPEGDPVTWTAIGLPTGLSIAPNGTITGTATTAGTYTVSATADDGQGNTDMVTFTWTVDPAPVPAPALTSPAAGSTLACSNQTFTWSGNATRYAIYLGTSSQVFYDLHQSGGLSAGTTSYTIPTLPTDGSPVTLRFYYFENGAWSYDEVQYTACTPPATGLISPVAGSTLACSNQTITWAGSADRYAIYLGTSSQVFYDLHQSGGLSAGTTSYTIPTLPTDGSPVTLRFYYFENGAWSYDEVQYTAC